VCVRQKKSVTDIQLKGKRNGASRVSTWPIGTCKCSIFASPPSLSTTSLYSPPLFFYRRRIRDSIIARVIFILLLLQSLRRKNIIASYCIKLLNFAINNLINLAIIDTYSYLNIIRKHVSEYAFLKEKDYKNINIKHIWNFSPICPGILHNIKFIPIDILEKLVNVIRGGWKYIFIFGKCDSNGHSIVSE